MCREKKIDRIKRNTRLFSSLGETSLRTIKLDWATKKLIRGRGESSLDVQVWLVAHSGGRVGAIFYYDVIITQLVSLLMDITEERRDWTLQSVWHLPSSIFKKHKCWNVVDKMRVDQDPWWVMSDAAVPVVELDTEQWAGLQKYFSSTKFLWYFWPRYI